MHLSASPLATVPAVSQQLIIRRPDPSDAARVAELFAEMQAYYGRPVPAATSAEAAALACSPTVHAFDPRVLIALAGDRVVGSLVMNVTFPAFELTRSLYIRDLYITESHRRCGVGTALVRAAAQLALDEGFSAIEWTTETANAAARKMYEACCAVPLNRTYYRLFSDRLTAAALGRITEAGSVS